MGHINGLSPSSTQANNLTKILFINPSIRESDVPKHVPYGMLMVATCAEEWFGSETALLDLNALRSVLPQPKIDAELVDAIGEEQWDIIGIGGITTA